MDNKGKKLDCAIVRDLISLYHDDAVSDVTKAAVKEHLEDCTECRSEYDSLCEELPINVGEKSTGKQFASMMKKQKIKKMLFIVLPIILACALLITGYFVQLNYPVVGYNEEVIDVVQVFKFENYGKTKFFILFRAPLYEGLVQYTPHTEYTEDGAVLSIDFDHPIITEKTDPFFDFFIYDDPLAGNAPFCDEITEVCICGKTVWTEAENGNAEVPAYVYAFDMPAVITEDTIEVNMFNIEYNEENPAESTVTVGLSDGRIVTWDFSGKVIEETTADDFYADQELDITEFESNE